MKLTTWGWQVFFLLSYFVFCFYEKRGLRCSLFRLRVLKVIEPADKEERTDIVAIQKTEPKKRSYLKGMGMAGFCSSLAVLLLQGRNIPFLFVFLKNI